MAEQTDLLAAGLGEALPPAAATALADRCAELRARLLASGTAALDEGDTLALVLAHCAPPGADVVGAADALLARFGGIGRVLGAPETDLAQVVGASAAAELGLLHALLVRALSYPLRRRQVLTSTEAVTTYLRARLTALPREAFHVLFLDRKNQLIADERMGEGSVDHAPVYPREVVRRALELSASALCIAHNHPSGDPTPSRADIEMTQQVADAARALGIALHDHFLVAGDQVVSFRAAGLM
jgi:DNA repair protein RadC